jgi:hypothetical protein
MPPDLARIAFVTRRFSELQGLQSVCLGTILIAGVLSWSLLPDEIRDPFQQIAFPAVMCTGFIMWIALYYRRWFGRVPPLTSVPGAGSGDAREILYVSPLPLALGADMVKGLMYPGGPSLAAAGLAVYSLWILVRDGSHRPHYVIGLAAGIAGIFVTWAAPFSFRVGRSLDPAVALPYVLTYAVMGAALVVVGLLDHRLLAAAMGQGHARGAWASAPDPATSRLRAVLAATCLVAILAYIALFGWPGEAQYIYWAIYFAVLAVMIVGQRRALKKLRAEQRRAAAERQSAREDRLAAKVAAMRGEVLEVEIEPPSSIRPGPPFDLAGHLLLPIAMACGALLDITLRGSGVPSLLALALAASHLRISLRDWPSRKHYLLGTMAASISAVHFMFVPRHQALDWTLWFLILVCAAMCVEGLLDYRLTRSTGPDFSRERHADAI